jgi:hypothetical protein
MIATHSCLITHLRYSVYKKRVSFNSSANFIFGKLNEKLSNRDFNSALDFNIYNQSERLYYWGLAAYEKSFSLKIRHRAQSGAGVGFMLIDEPNAIINISDGILYEFSELNNIEESTATNKYEMFRNSFRLKFRFIVAKDLTLEGSHFLQHSLEDKHDYIIRSNTTLSYKLLRWISFTSGVTYNKMSETKKENLLINFGLTLDRYF